MPETAPAIDEADESDDVDEAHGAYLELSRTVSTGRQHRAWLGLRSELLWHEPEIGPAQRSLGISTRLSWELFSGSEGSGSKDTRCGFVAGVWQGASAIGLFVETGARAVEGAPTEMVATAGVSVRLPIVMGVGMDLCSW
jgi:hypothetical protein